MPRYALQPASGRIFVVVEQVVCRVGVFVEGAHEVGPRRQGAEPSILPQGETAGARQPEAQIFRPSQVNGPPVGLLASSLPAILELTFQTKSISL